MAQAATTRIPIRAERTEVTTDETDSEPEQCGDAGGDQRPADRTSQLICRNRELVSEQIHSSAIAPFSTR